LYVEGAFVAGLIDETLPVAKVLSVHDAGGLRACEMLKCDLDSRTRLEYSFRKYTDPRYERLVYPRFDSVVVVSERDASYLRRLAPSVNFAVIPNGVDTEYFSPCEVPKAENVVVFHGNLSYSPNVDAVLEFSDHILPLVRQAVPGTRFRVVGTSPTKEVRALGSRAGIEVLADLPDLRPALSSANVYGCAVRYGTGVKNKVLEAMALRLPMVAYEPGSTSGIDCENGKHLLTAQNREAFASRVIDLLCHSEKAQRIALAAREFVCSKYSWETRAKAFEELFVTVNGRDTGNRRAG
jgi:glycosyltransferase involved in cell wall biosynthesis